MAAQLAFSRPDGVGLVDFEEGVLNPIWNLPPLQTRGDWAWMPGMAWQPQGEYLFTVDHPTTQFSCLARGIAMVRFNLCEPGKPGEAGPGQSKRHVRLPNGLAHQREWPVTNCLFAGNLPKSK